MRGHGAKYGRLPLAEVVAHYTREKANIREPAMLIRINKLYRYGMTDVELYDATRSAWKVRPKREEAECAFSVFEGVVREVYTISEWLPAGSTFNLRSDGRGVKRPGRWEFVGAIAPDRLLNRYVNRYVGHLYSQGAQNSISQAPSRPPLLGGRPPLWRRVAGLAVAADAGDAARPLGPAPDRAPAHPSTRARTVVLTSDPVLLETLESGLELRKLG